MHIYVSKGWSLLMMNDLWKGLSTISDEVKLLAQKAKENNLKPEEYEGGTFTVSNLGGPFGVEQFCAIINLPQAAKKMVVPGAGIDQYGFASFMTVTLSCDHRVVDVWEDEGECSMFVYMRTDVYINFKASTEEVIDEDDSKVCRNRFLCGPGGEYLTCGGNQTEGDGQQFANSWKGLFSISSYT